MYYYSGLSYFDTYTTYAIINNIQQIYDLFVKIAILQSETILFLCDVFKLKFQRSFVHQGILEAKT